MFCLAKEIDFFGLNSIAEQFHFQLNFLLAPNIIKNESGCWQLNSAKMNLLALSANANRKIENEKNWKKGNKVKK